MLAEFTVISPGCDVIVHHGGSGTAGAALAAGKPMLICPFIFDQRFWGDQLKHKVLAAPCSLFLSLAAFDVPRGGWFGEHGSAHPLNPVMARIDSTIQPTHQPKGVCPSIIMPETATKLAFRAGLSACASAEVRRAASELGKALRSEDGVSATVALIAAEILAHRSRAAVPPVQP